MIRIDDPDDPRIAPYRELKERELAREGGRFIAEGELVSKRLWASTFQTESVLLAERHIEEMSPLIPQRAELFVASSKVVHSIVGYKFHSGVMSIGLRGDGMTLASAIPQRAKPATLVICPDLNNSDNLGAIIRIAAALGADAMLLGEKSCDPFFRRSIRVSMGAVFALPIVQSGNIKESFIELRRDHGFQLIATVLDTTVDTLANSIRPKRIGVVFGNESQGLSQELIGLCDRRVTIPMQLGVDSLNVAVSAGIVLHHFMR